MNTLYIHLFNFLFQCVLVFCYFPFALFHLSYFV